MDLFKHFQRQKASLLDLVGLIFFIPMDIAVGHIPHIIIENTYISWKDKMKPRITMEDGIIPEEYQAMAVRWEDDELGLQGFLFQAGEYLHHSQLDDVRRRALDWHVQRHTFAEGAGIEVAGLDLRQSPAAVDTRTELGSELRRMFTAEPGKVLVDADYSQIELRSSRAFCTTPSI